MLKEEYGDEASLVEKLRNEIEELNDVFNNWTYYDMEGLFFTIREKQGALHDLELSLRRNKYNKL